MKHLSAIAWLLLSTPALAQVISTMPRGQVFLPSGRPARQEIRLTFESETGGRPTLVYTDLLGRFDVPGTCGSCRITVESDGENWDTTTYSLSSTATSSLVRIFLLPLRKGPTSNKPENVTVNTLQQRVPPEARKEFDQALQFIKKNNFAAARPHLQQAVAIFPQYVDARNELAVALMRENKLTEAEEQLRTALQVDAVAVRPLMNLGLCLSRQEKWEDASEVLDKAVQLAPAEPNGHLLLGIARMKLGKNEDAEAHFKKAYELGGKKAAQAQYYLANVYIQQKDYPRAVVALETYLRDNPEDSNLPQLKKTLEQLRATPAKP